MTQPWSRRAVILGGLAVLPGFGSVQRVLAPDAEPWAFWEAHDPASRTRVDHRLWARFLDRHMRRSADGVNLITYGQVSENDRLALTRYLRLLVDTPVRRLSRDEQLAYWINLYNALTVRVVLDHYPVRSIREISLAGAGVAGGPWGARLVEVEGQRLSLNDIEHRIIRPIWQDPRIHYAVNCAAIGCPNLNRTPWRAADLETRFNEAAAGYINNPRGVSKRRDGFHVSRIYDWFIEDFGGTEDAVLAHLRRYAEPELAAELEETGRLAGQFYDWRLNDATGA